MEKPEKIIVSSLTDFCALHARRPTNKIIEIRSLKNIVIADDFGCDIYILGFSHLTVVDDVVVNACENSRVTARDSACVHAYGNARIFAHDRSRVYAYDNTRVVARDTSRVEANNTSFVEAHDKSCIFLRDFARVDARPDVSVFAYRDELSF